VGQASIAHVRSQPMGNLGEKRWPKKSPHFHGVIRPGGFFFPKKKEPSFLEEVVVRHFG